MSKITIEVESFEDEDELLNSIESELSEKYKIAKPVDDKNPTHYVNNREFTAAIVEYITQYNNTPDGSPRPKVSNYIGECFLRIARKVAVRSNFWQYTYRDDMIGDAVEDCLIYMHNFDVNTYSVKLRKDKLVIGRARISVEDINKPFPEVMSCLKKVKMLDGFVESDTDNLHEFKLNPFGYFTTYIWNAFVGRIEEEEKKRYIRAREIQRAGIHTDSFSVQEHDIDEEYQNNMLDFLRDNDSIILDYEEKIEKRKEKKLAASRLRAEASHASPKQKLGKLTKKKESIQ